MATMMIRAAKSNPPIIRRITFCGSYHHCIRTSILYTFLQTKKSRCWVRFGIEMPVVVSKRGVYGMNHNGRSSLRPAQENHYFNIIVAAIKQDEN